MVKGQTYEPIPSFTIDPSSYWRLGRESGREPLLSFTIL